MDKAVSKLAQATSTGAKTVRIVEIEYSEVNHSLKFISTVARKLENGTMRRCCRCRWLEGSRKDGVVQAEATSTNANTGEIVEIRLMEIKRQ